MTKQEHIIFWRQTALEDEESVRVLFQGKRYMMCLFVCHLMIEKLLKAHWVKDNEDNIPPFTHNLELLHNQTALKFPDEDLASLRLINAWNIEGRYVDYKQKFYQLCTQLYTEKQLIIVEKIKICLLNNLL